jgi:hypothetical protein
MGWAPNWAPDSSREAPEILSLRIDPLIPARRRPGDDHRGDEEIDDPEDDDRALPLKAICTELKIEPKTARRRLRAAGMKTPYTDAAKIRAARSRELPTRARARTPIVVPCCFLSGSDTHE